VIPQSKSIFLLGIGLAIASGASSQSVRPSQFEPFKGDGYYWYRQEPEPEAQPPKKEPPKSVVSVVKTGPKPLSMEWMRENAPKLLDIAANNPTHENVANYMYAQRVILDRSQNFSEQVKAVVAMDPFLDENNRVPIAQFAQPGFLRAVKKGQEEVLQHLAGRAGLWVFVDAPDKCSACEGYVRDVLVGNGSAKGVANQYGFNFRKIDVSTEAGRNAAKRLNLKVTPTTVLVVPPAGYYLVSQGLMSQTQLQDRLLIASKTAGHLPKEMEQKVNPYNKDVLTTEDMNGLTASSDPGVVMKELRQRIKGE
jgi:conjugal transfer pilus assembly protein TraF